MDFERTFEDFLMEAETYSAWGRLERADSYLYRFYDVAITFAPSVPLRRAFEESLHMRDKVFVSFSGTYDLHLQTDFYREVHKWVDGLGSVTNSNYFAPSEELQSIAAKIVA